MLEHHTLKGGQACRIEMFYDFHDSCGIEALQPLVAVRKAAMNESDPLSLAIWQPVQPQPTMSDLQRSNGHVHANNLRNLLIRQELAKQFAFSTPQIKHAFGSRSP